jgi:cytochrome c6
MRGDINLRRLISFVWVAIALLCLSIALFLPMWTDPVLAEAPEGQQIFNANCSACHIGGNNVIIANKTLKQDALEKYEMNSLDAIQNQVINGKNAMPSFKDRLTDEEVAAVASYVLRQAEAGW